MSARIASINVSDGGVPKRPVPVTRVTAHGLEGDRHRDSRHHGGPARALCLFAVERIEALAAEGHSIAAGTIGENITVAGLDWERVTPGNHYRIGDQVLLQITTYASPCSKIQAHFLGQDYPRVSQTRHPGWSRVYARVLATGDIRRGDPVIALTPDEARARLA